ncbi:2-amino-4-hydroxy-6-hydroxymethyldihydropteridine pyrophosphokinase [bacterium 336/3]|nr:2-amino-4-hydroxy-6-hydroxymethyldihydropteridine pyrophosphokinase [bacterium 336/3]
MHFAYILLGSNLGNREAQLNIATQAISKLGSIVKHSSVYETAAWGLENQADFLNQVLVLETELMASLLLENLLHIEKEMGRERLQKWSSRIIDLDILYFDNQVIDIENLKIPHPYLQQRRFTLLPLCEISPDFLHPVLQKTNRELLETCPDTLEVRKHKG